MTQGGDGAVGRSARKQRCRTSWGVAFCSTPRATCAAKERANRCQTQAGHSDPSVAACLRRVVQAGCLQPASLLWGAHTLRALSSPSSSASKIVHQECCQGPGLLRPVSPQTQKWAYLATHPHAFEGLRVHLPRNQNRAPNAVHHAKLQVRGDAQPRRHHRLPGLGPGYQPRGGSDR